MHCQCVHAQRLKSAAVVVAAPACNGDRGKSDQQIWVERRIDSNVHRGREAMGWQLSDPSPFGRSLGSMSGYGTHIRQRFGV